VNAPPAAADDYLVLLVNSDYMIEQSNTGFGSPNAIPIPINVTDNGNGTFSFEMTNFALANDIDPDGDTLTTTGVSPVPGITVGTPTFASVHYTTQQDYVGYDEFAYTVSDGHGGTASAHVHIQIVKPAISVTKTASPTTVSEGGVGNQQVTYTYQVTNTTGYNLPLLLNLTDNNGTPNPSDDFTPTYVSGDTNLDGKIGTDEVWTFTKTVTVPIEDAGATLTNTVDATGTVEARPNGP